MKHTHNFIPYKRMNRLVLSKCKCGNTKTDMIKNFTKERADQMDAYIAKISENSEK